jgi:Zn-dependent peptidase ImmA (M78 family)/DNA-binding XRE family transcriptional regulator
MAKSITALVQPALLVWARERAGFSRETAAGRIDVDLERLIQWEEGTDRPSMAQLRKIGEVYKRPIAVFFLSAPPMDFDPQKEFRRLPGLSPQNESPALRLALRTALYRREAAREVYERLGEPLAVLTGALHPNQRENAVSLKVREILGITWEDQLSWASEYVALNCWRSAIESKGVLVFQTGGIELSEMRGTSIPQGPIPVILINNDDTPHGRIFTLIHEFVHILLTNGGHRTSTLEGERLPEDQFLERISNRFAAAILMPQIEFQAEAAKFPEVLLGDDRSLKRLAQRIKVSPESILRRLVSLGKTQASVYRERRKAWQANSRWYVPAQGEGGPPIEVKVVSSRGKGFVSLILEGYQRNVLSSSAVTDLLGVQLKYLDKVARLLVPGPGEGVAA